MDRDVSQNETIELTQSNLGSSLLHNQTNRRVFVSADQRGSMLFEWLRQLRLQITSFDFDRSSRWKIRSRNEHPKIAMRHSRRMAALHSFFHLIPLSAAITLLILNCMDYWIGYHSPDSTSLQFVAKLHELLMQYSIAEIIICIIRTQAIHGLVPFGALSGAAHSAQLSYIWSLDFLSLWVSPALRGWYKALFVLGIPLLFMITALVGPSSAVLMIPRPSRPHSAPAITLFGNVSTEALFPSRIGRAEGLTLDLKGFSDEIDEEKQAPALTSVLDGRMNGRTYMLDHAQLGRPLRVTSEARLNQAIAPTRLVIDGLRHISRITYRGPANGTLSVFTPQPLVKAACDSPFYNDIGLDTKLTYFREDMNTSLDLANVSSLIPHVTSQGEISSANIYNWTYQYFHPVWIPSPELGSHALVGVFFRWRHREAGSKPVSLDWIFSKTNTTERRLWLGVTTCTLLASWYDAETKWKYEVDGEVYRARVTHDLLPVSNISNEKPITLNLTGVESLGNSTAHTVLASLKTFQTEGAITAYALAAAFAAAISSLPFEDMLPDGLSTPGLWIDFEPQAPSSKNVSFTVTNTLYGYGYGIVSTSIILSVTVLSTYCIITILYLLYILITGSTSTAWNSAIELIALALHSKTPDHLPNITAGIDCLETLNESVSIRVNAEDKLELVFANDVDDGLSHRRKVRRNEAYQNNTNVYCIELVVWPLSASK